MSEMPQFSRDYDPRQHNTSLAEKYGSLMELKRTYSLLPGLDLHGSEIGEWIGEKDRQHLITFPVNSEIMKMHTALDDHGVHVYPRHVIEEDSVLEIPKGTKLLRSVTNFIERDPEHYSVVFRLLGEELSVMHKSSIGTPVGNWLDRFAYSPDLEAEYGANLFFLPPYKTTHKKIDITADIGAQLADTTNLSETTIIKLMWETLDGWNRG